MSAQLESVPDQGTLFSPKSFIARRVAMGLRGAGNLGISDDESQALAAADGTEQIIEIRVYATVKGYTKQYDSVEWNCQVSDARVVLDDEE